MTTVEINASSTYQVEIGHGLLPLVGERIRKIDTVRRVCIVSDSNVWPLYGETVLTSLLKAGIQTFYFLIPAGERSKSSANYLELLNYLSKNHLDRNDMIVALGGGVVGDLAGFAAATYLRGIRFVQLPTTLLAAVDSSVGGKTAINLDSGKNLAGAFHQPSLVLCDLDTLSTLPDEIFRDGCAEIIKTAVLFDPGLFQTLCRDGLHFDRESVIASCVTHKRDIISADEFDLGLRQLLNFGHTVGHCVEALSGYTVSHGRAVSIGMAVVSRMAVHMGVCTQETATKIQWLLMSFELPTTTSFTAEEIAGVVLNDKKCSNDLINLILPGAIGRCYIHQTSLDSMESLLEAGL